ncbi:MAG: Ig-like domain-containing protein, partial [Bacteroidales bacterium]|nr:Ig-like domain-containing protein [Bacteroidales bacterium]
MQTNYYSILSSKIVKKPWLMVFLVFFSTLFFTANLKAQTLLDNYDGTDDLTYTTEGTWSITGGQYEGQNGGASTPEHSYASYDLSNSFSGYILDKANTNTWFGWIDLNNDVVSGWGSTNKSAGMVLAANSSDFNATTTSGYAVVLRNNPDELVIIRFDNGITSGATNLPDNSTEIVSSGYTYADSDNGVNFFVEYLSDGTWKISYLAGAKLSDANAVDKAQYTGGDDTSLSAEETYTGSTYKYAGWVYAHGSTTNTSYFDNFGASYTDNLPPVATWDPADGDIGVAVDGDITITFNEAIQNTDGSAITDLSTLITLKLDDSGGADVSYSATIDGTNTIITITPDVDLTNSQLYYVAIAAVEDANGNETSGESISFTAIGPEPTNDPNDKSITDITHIDITINW